MSSSIGAPVEAEREGPPSGSSRGGPEGAAGNHASLSILPQEVLQTRRDSSEMIRQMSREKIKARMGSVIFDPSSSSPPTTASSSSSAAEHGTLFGRSEQLDLLREAYCRVRRTGGGVKSELVLIAGASGSGKSALAYRLRKTATRGGGYFCAGKFDERRSAEPYTAILAAFAELCGDIASGRSRKGARSSSARRRAERTAAAVEEAARGEGALLLDVVPGLRRIVAAGGGGGGSGGDAPPADGSGGGDRMEARNRFNFALRRFVRAVCGGGAAAAPDAAAEKPSPPAGGGVAVVAEGEDRPSPPRPPEEEEEPTPLVLFLDDLQWADAASLELMETLLTDRENPHLLILGAYRDDEVDASHPLARRLDRIGRGDAAAVSTVRVGALDEETVNHLVSDLLDCTDDAETRPLADVVHRKTGGNAFFVVEFLKSLVEEGTLSYSISRFRWQWELDRIRSKTVTDNVVDLMRGKIRKLDPQAQGLLQVAACLGSTFTATMLALSNGTLRVVSDRNGQVVKYEVVEGGEKNRPDSIGEVKSLADICVDEGLLDRLGDGDPVPQCADQSSSPGTPVEQGGDATRYKFVHDQVQLAAYSLLPEDERNRLQLHMGIALLELGSIPAEFEKILFVVVDMMNSGKDFIPGHGEENQIGLTLLGLANLNLQAGNKAMASTAFMPAAAYLKTGLSMLGQNHWEEQYELSLDLFSGAAEAEYCNGNFAAMQPLLDQVLSQEKPCRDKFRSYCTLLYALGVETKSMEAIDTCRDVLAQLGLKFPNSVPQHLIVRELLKTKFLLRGKPISTLSALPEMKDESKVMAMQILDILITHTYLAKPELLPLAILKMVRWSVRYGVCKYSAVAFSAFGIVCCGSLGDLSGGYEYGQLALALVDRFKAKELPARTSYIVNGFIVHWTKPMQLGIQAFLDCYHTGMEMGDLHTAMMSLYAQPLFSFFAGQPLPLIEAGYEARIQQQKEGFEEMALENMLIWQTMLNLMGRCNDPLQLTGDAMDQDEMLKFFVEKKIFRLQYGMHILRTWLAFYFGDYELAGKMADKARNYEAQAPAHPFLCRYIFFEGLTAFVLSHNKQHRKEKSRGKKAIRRLKNWAKGGNMNCLHMLHILQAEEAVSQKRQKVDEMKGMYDLAISTASRHGFVQDAALANERAGLFFHDAEDPYWAKYYFGKAHQLYIEWGAQAKADQIGEKYSTYL